MFAEADSGFQDAEQCADQRSPDRYEVEPNGLFQLKHTGRGFSYTARRLPNPPRTYHPQPNTAELWAGRTSNRECGTETTGVALWDKKVRTDWFIFSRLRPYSTWGEFAQEAERFWRLFASVYSAPSIQGVSVRFINELGLGPGENVEKYLKFYINVPEGVPQSFVNYFARIELQQSQDTIATIQSGLLPPLPDKARLFLDIELAKTVAPKDESELWAAIHGLREPKNQIFFGCITDEWKARLR
jgi:hypothetical protein